MSSSKAITARVADAALRDEYQKKYGVDHFLVSPDIVALIDLAEETVQLFCLLDLAAMGESEEHGNVVAALKIFGSAELTIPYSNLEIPMTDCDKEVILRIINAIGSRIN